MEYVQSSGADAWWISSAEHGARTAREHEPWRIPGLEAVEQGPMEKQGA